MLNIINSRRSVRVWTQQPVAEEDVHKIIEAGMNAPSAGNEQPWYFIVVNDREILAKASLLNPHGGFVKNAAVAILVCADLRLERFPGCWVQDCSAAAENMLLASHALGIGAVWTSVYPIEERMRGFSSLFNLPKEVIPFALIPLGYSARPIGEPKSRFNPSRILNNRWE
jgi:nitroreductase